MSKLMQCKNCVKHDEGTCDEWNQEVEPSDYCPMIRIDWEAANNE